MRVEDPVATSHVPREGGLAVRRRLDQDPPPVPGRDLRLEQAQDVRPAAEPGRHRRHLPPGVLGQQAFQRGQIGLLEGCGVLVEQRTAYGLVRFAELLLRRCEPGELRTSALKRAVHRSCRRLQQLSHLDSRPGQYVPQYQYCALPRRQVLQGSHHRQSKALPSSDHCGRVRVQQQVRERLQPADLELPAGDVVRICAGRSQRSRDHPAAAVLQGVQADPGSDPVEPGLHRRPSLEVREASPSPQVGLLHRVLGIVQRPEHPVAVRHQLAPVLRELLLQVHPTSSTDRAATGRNDGRRTPAREPEPGNGPDQRQYAADHHRPGEPGTERDRRSVAAAGREHRSQHCDSDHAAELPHHAVDPRGDPDGLTRQRADAGALRGRHRHRDPAPGDDHRRHQRDVVHAWVRDQADPGHADRLQDQAGHHQADARRSGRPGARRSARPRRAWQSTAAAADPPGAVPSRGRPA